MLASPLRRYCLSAERWLPTYVCRVTGLMAVLSEPELLQAMFDVGYLPPNTPPLE